MSTRRIPIAQLGGTLAGISAWLKRLGVEVIRTAAGDLAEHVVSLSPVGTPGKTSVHPGKYRGSHTISLGAPRPVRLPDRAFYPVPGRAEFDAALRGATLLVPVFVSNAATSDRSKASLSPDFLAGKRSRGRRARAFKGGPYSPYLDPGRITGGRWSPKSKQAPQGVYAVAVPALKANNARIVKRAVARNGGEP